MKNVKIEGKKVTTTTTETRELGKYEFICEGCKEIHTMSAYAIAQISSHNPIIFTCTCKEKTTLEDFN